MVDMGSISPHSIHIRRKIASSDASSIFEIECDAIRYAMKVYHNNGDPGFADNGRDLNRFRCEFSAYQNLSAHGVCEKGVVPRYYGHIDQLDPKQFRPHLDHFIDDLYHPKAMIFEYLPNDESMNCVNYSKERFQKAIDGIQEIHKALVHHQDVYPRNILLVPGDPERTLWIDFDVATAFSSRESMGPEEEYILLEYEYVKDFGELLREDQEQGLPPNTKFY